MIVLEDDVDVNEILKPTKTTKRKFTQDGKPEPQTTKPKAKKLKPSELPKEELDDFPETYTSEKEQEQEEHEGLDGFDEDQEGQRWIKNALLHIDNLDPESGYYSMHTSQDGDDVPTLQQIEDEFDGIADKFDNIYEAEENEPFEPYIETEIEELVRDVTTLTPKSVAARIKKKFGVVISYYTTWNAKTICMEKIVGSYDEGYK
ncbi:hypothetical protein GIB67_035256 [Kingdonia uniflora]|uniref:Transposase n=1 Tax=Kingdonia uniflora TaxID=39325 RepID=A0A7J7KXT3_9MAGN|nr:hypothetical protein GIB67_035256 [Kingdonia uniflora]